MDRCTISLIREHCGGLRSFGSIREHRGGLVASCNPWRYVSILIGLNQFPIDLGVTLEVTVHADLCSLTYSMNGSNVNGRSACRYVGRAYIRRLCITGYNGTIRESFFQ